MADMDNNYQDTTKAEQITTFIVNTNIETVQEGKTFVVERN